MSDKAVDGVCSVCVIAMTDILSTAQRLRAVNQARRKFLSFWAAERLIEQSGMIERMAADLDSAPATSSAPAKHDWSPLYRGSVLDD